MSPNFRIISRLACWTALFSTVSHAFYVPAYSMNTYTDDESIPLLVNKVYSDNTQLQYAYFELPFVCPPSGKALRGSLFGSGHSVPLNLGEVLRGDRIMTSDFEINMKQDIECRHLCDQTITRNDVRWAQQLIDGGYVGEWILDNLPGATPFVTVDRSKKYYSAGFKLGEKELDAVSGKMRHILNNHFTLVVRWREAPGKEGIQGGKVVVGFEVYTKSMSSTHRNETGCSQVSSQREKFQLYIPPNNTELAAKYPDSSYLPEEDIDANDGASLTIPYTYSVYFREDNSVEWSNRWDLYFSDLDESSITHWLAILNSLIISGILGAILYVVLGRVSQVDLRGRGDGSLEDAKLKARGRKGQGRDRASPKAWLLEKIGESEGDHDLVSDDDFLDDVTGWKLLHGDVFRPPPYAGLFAPMVGSGLQLLFMVSGLLLLSCLGILNPSFRGGFVSVGVGLFIFAGSFSGYYSARVYKTFGGQNWIKNTMMTAVLFPGLVFCLIWILNLFVWAQASSTALPFGTLVGLALLWLLAQVPLVSLGSCYGYFKAQSWSHPTKTHAIARQIPATSWHTRSTQVVLLSGLAPFAVLFIELMFVFQSVWQDKSAYYYVFGFLSVVSTILVVTVSEVTILATYFQLCSENHEWWWQSFFVGGASGFWVFVYCIWYYATRLHIQGFISSMLFFSYSFLACVVYSLLTGTVGFLSAYAFVRRLYSATKLD